MTLEVSPIPGWLVALIILILCTTVMVVFFFYLYGNELLVPTWWKTRGHNVLPRDYVDSHLTPLAEGTRQGGLVESGGRVTISWSEPQA